MRAVKSSSFVQTQEFLRKVNAECRTFLRLKKTLGRRVGHCCCCALGLSEHIQDQRAGRLETRPSGYW